MSDTLQCHPTLNSEHYPRLALVSKHDFASKRPNFAAVASVTGWDYVFVPSAWGFREVHAEPSNFAAASAHLRYRLTGQEARDALRQGVFAVVAECLHSETDRLH